MSISLENKKTILEILNGTDKDILANIDLLAKIYLEKKGRKLNKGCSSCVTEMVLTLKNIYQMTQFKFKRKAASYKDKKGDTTTISNSTMTDEKALKFLKTNPKRIDLFSEYPSNWKQLIKGKVETEAEKEARLAAEAEAIEAAKAAASAVNSGSNEGATETETEKEARLAAEKAAEDAMQPSREELEKMKLVELREKYPDVKATSVKAFVDKVLGEE